MRSHQGYTTFSEQSGKQKNHSLRTPEYLETPFNEAEVYENEETIAVETPVAAHTRKNKCKSGSVKDILPKNCPVDVVEHRSSSEESVCKVCGTEMMEIGKEIHRSFKIIPAQVRLQEDWYYTYACKSCEKEEIETPILKTPQEKTLYLVVSPLLKQFLT